MEVDFMSKDNNQNDNKKNQKKSLYQFLDKEGFYIILFLCVCIVAVTAIWVSNQNQDPYVAEEESPLFEDPTNVTLVEEPVDEMTKETTGVPNKDEAVPPKNENTNPESNKVDETIKVQDEKELEKETEETSMEGVKGEIGNFQVMTMPVLGKIGLPFADDRLVYHKTLDQWSTHKGLDIHAEVGAPVRAALAGEVIEVINDTVMGITITIEHDENLLTRYSNLSTDAMVKVGDKITKGQIISGVGKTASVKSLEGPLLHFQVIYDGKAVDPQLYLSKIN